MCSIVCRPNLLFQQCLASSIIYPRMYRTLSNNTSSYSLLFHQHKTLTVSESSCCEGNSEKIFLQAHRLNDLTILPSSSIAWRGLLQFRCFHTTQLSLKKRFTRAPIVLKPKSKVEIIPIWRDMTVQELADNLKLDIDVIFEILSYTNGGHLFKKPSSELPHVNLIQEIVRKTGRRCTPVANPHLQKQVAVKDEDITRRPPPKPSVLQPRPPVLTIMGHVDHGKTTLLDVLRKSSIVETEFGGITQHIGAFQFQLENGRRITVLDTPGHAAFSSMRSRGANVTDIAVLVVAADDGVMQQTVESIQHARNAGVPIVVAINKIDKVDSDVAHTRRSLLNAGLILEDDGGDVQAVEISAKNKLNIDMLVEAILLQADLMDIKADPTGLVEATVIEANTEQYKGKVVTCLIERGTLKSGAFLVAGTAWARVKSMYNEYGNQVKVAPPATPVQVTGWKDLPSAGDLVLEVPSQKKAKDVVSYRLKQKETVKLNTDIEVIERKKKEHEAVYKAQQQDRLSKGYRFKMRRATPREKEIPPDDDDDCRVSIVLKCDVDGSMEAILQVLETYHSDYVNLLLIASGIGPVTPGDVNIAHAFKGTIYTFNVDVVDRATRDLADSLGVNIVSTNIIYRLVEQLKQEVSSKLPPLPKEVVLGEAEVQEEFLINEGKKKMAVAGCRCTKGTLKRKETYRVLRGDDQEVIHEGTLISMRHLKSEADTITKDKECGLKFADTSLRFKPGDVLVCYKTDMIPQVCDWSPPGF